MNKNLKTSLSQSSIVLLAKNLIFIHMTIGNLGYICIVYMFLRSSYPRFTVWSTTFQDKPDSPLHIYCCAGFHKSVYN